MLISWLKSGLLPVGPDRLHEKNFDYSGNRYTLVVSMSVLPTRSTGRYGAAKDSRFPALLRRVFDYRQMDFEAALDQLTALVARNLSVRTSSSYYRKQTKNQWARDDPGFLVIQVGLVALGNLFYAMIFESPDLWGYAWSIFYGLVVDWLLIGVIAASIGSFFANKYLRQYHNHTVEQSVGGCMLLMCTSTGFSCRIW